jgi:hypothetical protein
MTLEGGDVLQTTYRLPESISACPNKRLCVSLLCLLLPSVERLAE